MADLSQLLGGGGSVNQLRSLLLIGNGNLGISPNVCSEIRLNLFAEPHEDTQSGAVTLY